MTKVVKENEMKFMHLLDLPSKIKYSWIQDKTSLQITLIWLSLQKSPFFSKFYSFASIFGNFLKVAFETVISLLYFNPFVGRPVTSAMKSSIRLTVTPCRVTLFSNQFLKNALVTCDLKPCSHSRYGVTFPFTRICQTIALSFQPLQFLGSCFLGSPPILNLRKSREAKCLKREKIRKAQKLAKFNNECIKLPLCCVQVIMAIKYSFRIEKHPSRGPL